MICQDSSNFTSSSPHHPHSTNNKNNNNHHPSIIQSKPSYHSNLFLEIKNSNSNSNSHQLSTSPSPKQNITLTSTSKATTPSISNQHHNHLNLRPISAQSDSSSSFADLLSHHQTISTDSSFLHLPSSFFIETFPTTTTTTTTTTTSDTHSHHHHPALPHAPLSNTLSNPISKLSTESGCPQPKLRSVLMIHHPAPRRIRASQHTQLTSSFGGIGESPLNPKLHSQKTSTSLLHNIRHSRNASQKVDDTDHLIPPSDHTISSINSTYHEPLSLKPITNQLEHSHSHSLVANLGRAPISTSHDLSIQPSQALHSRQSQPTFIDPSQYEFKPWSNHTAPVNHSERFSTNQTHQQHPTPKFHRPVKTSQPERSSSPPFLSPRARSRSTMDLLGSQTQPNPSLKHAHSRSASAHHAYIPTQLASQAGSDAPIPSEDDSTYVRLRVLSFETLGGFYGKYADPKPRFATTTLSRPATSGLGTKRSKDLMEELAIEAPCHPRKITRSAANPRTSQSLEALKQRATAAAQTERSHAQRAWDEIYQLRLERELWRAEAEAACNPGLFCTTVFPSSPADLIRRQRHPHSRRRPSSPLHTRSDHSPAPRLPPFRSFSLRNRAQSAPSPPDQPSSPVVVPNPRKSSLSPFSVLHPPPRQTSISQPLTVRSYLKRPSSARSRPAARLHESAVKPASDCGSSRPLGINRALSPEVGNSHDGIFICCPQPRIGRGRARSNAAQSQPEPTLADVQPQSLKGLRRARSVPGLRRRRPPATDTILPPLPTNAPHNITAKELKHSPSYRLPSTESEPIPHLRATAVEAQIPANHSWFSNRGTEAFNSFFQRRPSTKSKTQTTKIQIGVAEATPQIPKKPAATHGLSENLGDQSEEFEKPYQGLTIPSNSTFNAHSSHTDSLCDPKLAPLGGEIPDDPMAHTAPADLQDLNLPSFTLQNTADAKLYSLPLVVPAPSESFNPLPPPPRRRNSTKNTTDSLSSKRSKSLRSGPSELAHSSPSASRSTSRCRGLSFINNSPPAVPTLGDSSYEAPPLTPTRPTTATNPTRPSPIIITPNLPSALVSLDRIRRLSSPDPLAHGVGLESSCVNPWRHSGRSSRTTSLISRGLIGTDSISRSRPCSPRSSHASPLSTQVLSRNLMDSTNVTSDDDGTHNLKEVALDTESSQVLKSPMTETENYITTPSQSTPVQSTSHSGESPISVSGGRRTRRRVRTMTELSESSTQSESSHSLIDLDKYIDQADLFYQVPASPRRDLIKRYSEQMTDRQRSSVRRPPMSPDRRSRLIDEVLSDYFHQSSSSSKDSSVIGRKSQEIDDQERPEGKETTGSLSKVESQVRSRIDGKKTKFSSGSRDGEIKKSRSASGTREGRNTVRLAPSIVDIYEARLSKE
ncbi:hypothetical protein DFH28DRAFT_912297 [Melampsora americana]|nr:hypothetical protein DFH28DRAFT_912297 [Melampsora americana]